VEDFIAKDETRRWRLPCKTETAWCTSYRPELDVANELSPQEAAYYQSLIGALRWIVELGRVDISRTGFLVWINSCLVYFLSKKQTSVETSSFGSEFVAMKQCCEYLRGLRYKLRMTGSL
jgi:hypothetical protein